MELNTAFFIAAILGAVAVNVSSMSAGYLKSFHGENDFRYKRQLRWSVLFLVLEMAFIIGLSQS